MWPNQLKMNYQAQSYEQQRNFQAPHARPEYLGLAALSQPAGLPAMNRSREAAQEQPVNVDVARTYEPLRDARDTIASYPEERNGHHTLQVSENFDLQDFLSQRQVREHLGMMDLKTHSLPRDPSQLAIHKFHKQNKLKGKRKNRGPLNGPQDLQAGDVRYYTHIRDPKIAAAISATHQLLSDSLEVSKHPALPHVASFPNQLYPEHSARVPGPEKQMIGVDSSTGLIDIEEAYAVVQLIKRAHGERTPSLQQVKEMLTKGQRATDRSKPAETSKERLQAYKWLEVMKFMQMNPHVLMQMLTIQERRQLR